MEKEFEIYKVEESTLGKDDVILLKINDFDNTPKSVKIKIAGHVREAFEGHKVVILPDYADISIVKRELGE